MKTGVLLGQVGTPEAPTPRAVARYLTRFLSDRRVVDYPPWLWQPLLRGVVVPLRARKSAALYRRIWTPQGSPLLVESHKQRERLQAALGGNYRVVLGMAYAGPSFEQAIDDLIADGVSIVIILPMFPQYSAATTGSVYDAAFKAAAVRRNRARVFVPSLQVVPPYYDHPAYIAALRRRIGEATAANDPDHIVVSFHGIPERYVANGDPYRLHCDRTAAALAHSLAWKSSRFTVSFQSRFGPERWLGPSTAEVLKGLHGRGIRRPLVVAPGFTTDCLETLDELGNEGRAIFVEGGGEPGHYSLCPCLTDQDEWVQAMAALVMARTATKP